MICIVDSRFRCNYSGDVSQNVNYEYSVLLSLKVEIEKNENKWRLSQQQIRYCRFIQIYQHSLPEKCLYLELLWSVFSRIWTEYEETRSISRYSVQIRENADHNNSEYRHFYAVIMTFGDLFPNAIMLIFKDTNT